MKAKLISICTVAAVFAAPSAFATNGYFAHGYGMKAKGMAVASTATAEDTFGGAVNPAKMVWVGNRIDFGADVFSPRRSAARTGSAAGINGSADSDSNYFIIPEFGYNKMIDPNLSLGVTVYGNGGMNTDYPGGQIGAATACAGFNPGGASYNLLCGNGRLGVDLAQLIVAPTAAYKVTPNHSLGISPLFAYQRFKAEGLQGFAGFTPSGTTNFLTNKGYDSSTGWGVRIGWMGKLSDSLTLGAAYSTKMKMSKFDKYKELFADQGAFDIPANYNLGVAFKATPKVTVAFDYQRINYSGVSSVANPSTNSAALGTSGGRGFGWSDVNVFKLGVQYEYSQNLTLRAGFNHGDNPIQARDVTFNIIAPGVVQDHLTLGLTHKMGTGGELTLAYMHAFSKSVTGSSLYNSFGVPAGTETIKMYQNSFGIAYGWKM
ncbi:MAG: outer membrane protein transport protein [Burkholderiales bacterium]|nr:outer membrane protein transport protein [Burkholderiales bacterium]